MTSNNVLVLEYKLYKEKLEIVQNEFDLGSKDLDARLQNYKKAFNSALDAESIKKVFKNIDNLSSAVIVKENKDKKTNNRLRSEIKKLYKQIVKMTHPDKQIGMFSKIRKQQLTEKYLKATDAYRENDEFKIVSIAHDLQIDISEVDLSYITVEIVETKLKIEEIKSKVGYQFYHTPEDKKEEYVANFLASFCF